MKTVQATSSAGFSIVEAKLVPSPIVPGIATNPASLGYAQVTVASKSDPTTKKDFFVEIKRDLGVTASAADDGNPPELSIDKNSAAESRWASAGEQWIHYRIGDKPLNVDSVTIQFWNGDTRKFKFDLAVSVDGQTWTTVLKDGQSSGQTREAETFSFAATSARFIKFLGHGSSANNYNHIVEFSYHTVGN